MEPSPTRPAGYLLASTEARDQIPNPYDPSRPAGATTFYGRREALNWVRRMLAAYRPNRPPLIMGPEGSGKTTLLLHLSQQPEPAPANGAQASHFAYVSLAGLPLGNVDEFLFALAEAVTKNLREQRVRLTPMPRQTFMAGPRRAFQQYFIEPVLAALWGNYLVVMLDDSEALLGDEGVAAEVRDYLFHLSEQQPRLRFLFTLRSEEEQLPAGLLSPFARPHTYFLQPLDRYSAGQLIQEPVPFKVYAPVADMLYHLSGGHPQSLQALCQGLFERWRTRGLNQVTVADVLTVARQVNPAVRQRLQLPAYSPATVPTPSADSSTTGSPRSSRLFRYRLLLLILAGLVVVLLLQLERREMPVVDRPATTEATLLAIAPASSTPAATSTAESPAGALLNPTHTPHPATPLPTATVAPTAVATTAVALPTTLPTPTVELIPSTATATATATAANIAAAGPETLPTRLLREADGMPLRLVPAGTFNMGTDSDRPEVGFDERPEHPVTLDAFYMDEYEVSAGHFASFLNGQPPDYQSSCPGLGCFFSRQRIGGTSFIVEVETAEGGIHYEAAAGFENYPVNHVSWYAARDYCTAVGGRLPTEAEWEYAARGTDGRIFPWGNERPDNTLAVFASESFADLRPVDALPAGASPFGILALAGSMWEWTADAYSPTYYQESPAENPTGPEDGSGRVTRGGGWPNNNQADRIRSTNRNWLEADYLSADVGFRCVVEIGRR